MVFVIPEGDAAWAEIVVKNVEVSSDGCATPVLREVSVGGKVNRDWMLDGDLRPPRVRRESPSPTLNTSETLRISVKENESFVLWDSLKVVVDGNHGDTPQKSFVFRENCLLACNFGLNMR